MGKIATFSHDYDTTFPILQFMFIFFFTILTANKFEGAGRPNELELANIIFI